VLEVPAPLLPVDPVLGELFSLPDSPLAPELATPELPPLVVALVLLLVPHAATASAAKSAPSLRGIVISASMRSERPVSFAEI
jgi:hypothetical protein